MKRSLIILFSVSINILAAGSAFAAGDTFSASTYSAGDPATGIIASRHNLGSLTNHLGTGETTEICVFCHTPHFTNTADGLKPMWNRGTAAPTSFTTYGMTIGGTTIASGDIGSTSLACLSCHDGVTAFDNLINAPGKGGISVTGSNQGWNFVDEGTALGASINMTTVGGRTLIGLDLSNDHPISVVYNGAVSATDFTGSRATLRASNTTISTIDLTSNLSARALGQLRTARPMVAITDFDGGNLTKNLWAVKGFINPDATIADVLRGPSGNRVECSSCHDPHFNNKSWNEVDSTWGTEADSNGNFLRRVGGNTASAVCRTCHAK